MSQSFSANQYENAFISNKLSNWECPDTYPERPQAQAGYTKIIANDRGHLQPGVPRSSNNPWGNFVGTWDIPKKIPGNCAQVTTARNEQAQEKLRQESDEAHKVLSGQMKNANRGLTKEASYKNTRPAPVQTTSFDYTDPLPRSGAEGPASHMFPPSSPALHSYQPALSPQAPRVDCIYSPIPGVPDIPEYLAQETEQPAASPYYGQQSAKVDGLSAL